MTHLDRPLLIHVAAESEKRGRVVLASRTATPNRIAIAAACDVARAFDTWIDCLLVECPDAVAATAYGFLRSVSHAGQIAPLSGVDIVAGQSAASQSARQIVLAAGQSTGVRVVASVARDDLAAALARACAIEGPWNIVALAEPVQAGETRWLRHLLDDVGGATGVVCVGAGAAGSIAEGDVVVVVEDLERLPQMLRAAERLSRPISLVVAGRTAEETAEIDGHLRLLLHDLPLEAVAPVTIVDAGVAYGTAAELAEALRRTGGSLVIARADGVAMPSADAAALLLGTLRCPLLLVR